MQTFIEFGAVFTVGVLDHLLGVYSYLRYPDYYRRISASVYLLKEWIVSLSAIFVVLLVALNQPEGLASVGIIVGLETNGIAILSGLLMMAFGLIFIGYFIQFFQYLRKHPRKDEINLSNPAVTNILLYRSNSERLAYLSALPYAAIAEELVYRGYFVLLLGHKTQTYLPWVILSVTFSVIIHLYQGRNLNNLVWHTVFALFFIFLALWTKNILATATAHILYNTIFVRNVWKKADQPAITKKEQGRIQTSAYILFAIVNFGALLFLLTVLLFVA